MDSEHSPLGQFFLIPIDTDINRAMPKSNTCKERILGQSQIFTLPPPFMGVLVHKVIMDESLQSKHKKCYNTFSLQLTGRHHSTLLYYYNSDSDDGDDYISLLL